MAEVQVKEGGGGKNKQKKQHLRVDFTPMVDMNMLLITFFMFCTTLLKPQTMNLIMPAKDTPSTQQSEARESTAVTLLLGADNELYFYLGKIDEKGEAYEDPDFVKRTGYGENGLRSLLLDKNKGTYELIQDLKIKLKSREINEEVFYEQQKEIQDKAIRELKIAPSIIIKPSEFASYKNVVDVLDEMLVCNIGVYAIDDLAEGDLYLLYKNTQKADYLTDELKVKYIK